MDPHTNGGQWVSAHRWHDGGMIKVTIMPPKDVKCVKEHVISDACAEQGHHIRRM
jgi:hypothetical protein